MPYKSSYLKQTQNGWCRVIATVMALPSPTTSGRLLLLLNSISEVTETSSSKRAKKKSSYSVGSLVSAEVLEHFSLVCYGCLFKRIIWIFCPDKEYICINASQVTEIMPLELRLKFGIGFRGRVHVTEVKYKF